MGKVLTAGQQLSPSHPYGRGLIGAWLCNEGAGSQLLDSSPHGVHGSQIGGPRWGGSQRGYALELDGIDDYVEIPSASHQHLQPKLGITVAAWVYSGATQNNKGLVGDWSASEFNWLLWLGPTTPTIRFYVRVGAASVTVLSSGAITHNRWTHLVGTWGRGADVSTIRLIVDGKDVYTGDSSAGPIDSDVSAIEIGRHADSNDRAFAGRIRDVLLWNRGMSNAEAKGIYRLDLAELVA